MNKFILHITGSKQNLLKPFKGVYHAPLIVDMVTKNCYRRQGFVSWPSTTNAGKQPTVNGSFKSMCRKLLLKIPGVKNLAS